jgi:DNA-binding NarL/FixJ family response regulator
MRIGQLSKRECEVLDLLCIGCSNAEIAEKLGISASTVKNHLRTTYLKLGASSRCEAMAVLYSV